jgi:signal recognition particle subunit SRP54
LAVWLKKTKKNTKILTVSCDIYRPAAIKQLETISKQADVDFYSSKNTDSITQIAENATQHAKTNNYDVLLVDTAGRLAIDNEMMAEITNLQKLIKPIETLFVVDSMQGQDALEVAKSFNSHIDLTGIILTKLDGDSRGGALLSVKSVTGCPAKFIGVSEKLDGLEKFDAQRFAKRLLGMGDVLSIVEKAQQSINQQSNNDLMEKIKSGKKFTLNEYRIQINQMRSMGGLSSLVGMLPSSIQEATKGKNLGDIDNSVKRQEGIILSMTPLERNLPEIIKSSRKQRIASGAGVHVQEVNKLINQFGQMQSMMKKMGGNTLNRMMKPFGGMPGSPIINSSSGSKKNNRKKRKGKRR